MPPFIALNNVVTDTTTALALEENGMPLKIYFNGPTHLHGITNTGLEKMLFYFWKWQA